MGLVVVVVVVVVVVSSSSEVVVSSSEVVVSSLVVDAPSSLLLPQEIMVRLKRNMEIMMSICLTWFPISGFRRTQVIPELGLIYKEMGILLGGRLSVEIF